MRRRLPGIERDLSAAFARVAKLYAAVPEHLRPDVNGERWQQLEAEIDRACGAGDRDAALLAIERWERHASDVLTRLFVSAPLEGRR